MSHLLESKPDVGSQVDGVSKYQGLTRKNEKGYKGGLRESTGSRKVRRAPKSDGVLGKWGRLGGGLSTSS